NRTHANDRAASDYGRRTVTALTDCGSGPNVSKILNGDVSIATYPRCKSYVVADIGIMLNVGIDVGMKETPDPNISRDRAKGANNGPFADFGRAHDNSVRADDGHRLEAIFEELLTHCHARTGVRESDVEERRLSGRRKKSIRAHNTDAIH